MAAEARILKMQIESITVAASRSGCIARFCTDNFNVFVWGVWTFGDYKSTFIYLVYLVRRSSMCFFHVQWVNMYTGKSGHQQRCVERLQPPQSRVRRLHQLCFNQSAIKLFTMCFTYVHIYISHISRITYIYIHIYIPSYTNQTWESPIKHGMRQWLFVNYKLLTARQMLIPLIEESEARETRCIWVADGFISSPDVCLAGGTVGSTKCQGISSDVSNIHCGSMLSDLKLWPTHWLPLCQGEVDHTSYDCVVQACATGSRRGPCFETSCDSELTWWVASFESAGGE